MKSLRKFFLILGVFCCLQGAFAASVNDDTKVTLINVSNTPLSNSAWKKKISIQKGDKVSFQLHYLIDYKNKAKNMTFFLQNLDKKIFKKGERVKIFGKITSTTVNSKTGFVIVDFKENVKLNFYNVSWQKWGTDKKFQCSSVGCETKLPQNARNVINGKGLNIGLVDGDSDKHYAGNLLITFKVISPDGLMTGIEENAVTFIDADKSAFDEIIALLKSINFWTILGSIIGILGTLIGTFITVKEYRKRNDSK